MLEPVRPTTEYIESDETECSCDVIAGAPAREELYSVLRFFHHVHDLHDGNRH